MDRFTYLADLTTQSAFEGLKRGTIEATTKRDAAQRVLDLHPAAVMILVAWTTEDGDVGQAEYRVLAGDLVVVTVPRVHIKDEVVRERTSAATTTPHKGGLLVWEATAADEA